jgi:hypothetical protein
VNRPRHLVGAEGRLEFILRSGYVITSAPGYVIFIDSIHNGRWQTITVDLEHRAGVIQALEDVRHD